MFIGAMTTALADQERRLVILGGDASVCNHGGLVSAPVGRLSLRVKGVYFFLVTLAFGQVVSGIFAYFQNPFGVGTGSGHSSAAAVLAVHHAGQSTFLLPGAGPAADHLAR